MKITSIDIFNTKVKSPVPGWAPVCVRVNTDEGICGWGETGIPVMSGRDATMTYTGKWRLLSLVWIPWTMR